MTVINGTLKFSILLITLFLTLSVRKISKQLIKIDVIDALNININILFGSDLEFFNFSTIIYSKMTNILKIN